MEKKKRDIIIYSVLCLMFVVIIVLFLIYYFNNQRTSNSLLINDEQNVVNDVDDSNNDLNNGEVMEDLSGEDDVNDKFEDQEQEDIDVNDEQYDFTYEEETDDIEIENDTSFEENEEFVYSEQDVVSYFESVGDEVVSSGTFKTKFKDYFINIVDFIFYDKEIKGYRFSELTNMAKLKIISIALKIDSKIEEYVPGYKETISNTGSKVYNDIKEKLVISYMDISTVVCKDNESQCDKVKELFSDVKDKCKIGWDFIKALISDGVFKLKDWYEIYSGK